MKEFRFYKAPKGTWWINLDAYIAQGGDPAELQMVAGADDFLELISEGSNEVRLQISEKKVKDFYELKRVDEIPTVSGRYYYDDQNESLMWLCPVTLWIFEGVYPEVIYYKPVKCKIDEVDPGPHNSPPRNSISNPNTDSARGLENL